MITITGQVEDLHVLPDEEAFYHAQELEEVYAMGVEDTKEMVMEITHKYDQLLNILFDELCDRHADDLVHKLKVKYGLVEE